LGELGMDMEGFSGIDGRTTIFDYWNVSSINAWVNKGKFDGKLLNDEQKNLRAFYQNLLQVCLKEKAITEGAMYDLEYANFDNQQFNTHEHFAYIRKYKNEILIVALNFNDRAADIKINIPSEAFTYLNWQEGDTYSIKNLLNKTEEFPEQVLSGKNQFQVFMPPWEGKILKLKKM
jgi:glycosidase